ncbi:non-classical arabinogalactan 31-like [Olea europaea subsp. europaea]|uniref:Non-classical arabinogalactan 31-like n=1 Tax=Olea europaea subsp. europaea TaxID=158383 RepID=A0A8S0RV78_OLEEU|nr:non-classical arabinogalactan 31-like [Olea europaea subsp. europaea]
MSSLRTMALFSAKALALLHFLVICTAEVEAVNAAGQLPYFPSAEAPAPSPKGGHHHHHHHHPSHPPTQPPAKQPPTHPPAKQPPTHPPVNPPTHPPSYPPTRKYVAVQGVVYCKSCQFKGIDTLMGASPLPGAAVKLQCNNTKYHLVEQVTTDKNGYFFIMPKMLTTAGSHKCKVFLVSSPKANCSVPTNLHGGAGGAILKPSTKPPVTDRPLPFQLFTVGPFAFEPHKNVSCHY